MAGIGSERTQFKPGKSGNPGGRPKSKVLSSYLAELLVSEIPLKAHNKENTVGFQLAKKLISEGLKGDMQAVKMIFDRTEGQAIQRIDMNADVNMIEMIEVVVPPDSETQEAELESGE